jgi:hypothetical protein
MIPVAGVAASQLQDTFGDNRGSDGERAHEALDIMAPRGTPVLAASDGKVEKLFTSVPGGLTIYQFDPTRTWAYYYAHLDRYAPGLAEGRQLKRGDVIGYVGSTGNASEDAPHLHFAIFVLGPGKRWWQGTAIDPYPLLKAPKSTRKKTARRLPGRVVRTVMPDEPSALSPRRSGSRRGNGLRRRRRPRASPVSTDRSTHAASAPGRTAPASPRSAR